MKITNVKKVITTELTITIGSDEIIKLRGFMDNLTEQMNEPLDTEDIESYNFEVTDLNFSTVVGLIEQIVKDSR